MRRVVTFFLLVGMLGGFGVLMYARPAPPELAPSADAKPEGADAKAEAEVFAGIVQALGVDTSGTGLPDMRTVVRG